MINSVFSVVCISKEPLNVDTDVLVSSTEFNVCVLMVCDPPNRSAISFLTQYRQIKFKVTPVLARSLLAQMGASLSEAMCLLTRRQLGCYFAKAAVRNE